MLEGVVVRGDGRGRALGFPTANVSPEGAWELPEDGVYAGWAELADGTVHVAAVSVGRRPTYYEHGDRLLEAYLLDFDGDLYEQRLRVEVGGRVRGQLKFSSAKELVAQMEADVAAVREIAGTSSPRLGAPAQLSEGRGSQAARG